uniref:NADH dehydrogenase [ubiquinone] 1 alpha subcomplex subunit 12 n=1 Tax=Mucochytrium quahogii TaxID=96639 RepID=A0A7S2RCD4_9STRA|mmetsp:Transcript_11262/g.18404  ORF Transcript_11262/g.18404 Transcript_11262/m.18404 type:complete len:201 (-) Transcript_11262:32-634(-)
MSLYLRAFRELGFKGTVEHFWTFRQIKFGTYKGTDEMGNKYFENLDLPYGQHRWWQPKEPNSPQLVDASLVSPRWHGWLHSTTDVVPDTVEPTLTGSPTVEIADTPVHDHYNRDHTKSWRQNPTHNRERGYGVKNIFGKMFENDFYVQPGHQQDPFHSEPGPKIEAWSGVPTGTSKHTNATKEKWEVFYEQRKQMNKEKK